MDIEQSLRLLKMFERCPMCGNNEVTKGNGSLTIDDNTFVRICNCGCEIRITQNNASNKVRGK